MTAVCEAALAARVADVLADLPEHNPAMPVETLPADELAPVRAAFIVSLMRDAPVVACARLLAEAGVVPDRNFFRDCCLEAAMQIAGAEPRGDGWLWLLIELAGIRRRQEAQK